MVNLIVEITSSIESATSASEEHAITMKEISVSAGQQTDSMKEIMATLKKLKDSAENLRKNLEASYLNKV